MPLDPSIPLSVRPPQVESPVQQFGNLLALKSQQQQMQAGQIDLQQKQLQLKQTQALNDAYRSAIVSNPDGTSDIDPGRLTKALSASGAGSAIPKVLESVNAYKKGIADLQESQGKVAALHADNGGAMGSAIKDAGYDPHLFLALTQHGIQSHAIDPQQAAPYMQKVQAALQQDPSGATAKQMVQQIADSWIKLSPKQQELSNAAITAAARQTTADTGQKRLEAELPGIQAGTVIKQQEATGTKPIQPAEQAQIAATQAQRAETARHNTVEEAGQAQSRGIAAGQLSVARGRLGVEQQRYGFESSGGVSEAAKMAAAGQMSPQLLRSMMRSNPGLVNQIRQIDPNFDEADIDKRFNTLKEFNSSSTGKAGGQVIALNTLIHHADLYLETAAALKNGTFVPGNSVYNAVATAFGSAPPTQANLVARFFAGETSKVATGGVPAEGEINGLLKSLGSSASPDQIAGAGKTLLQIAAGRMTPLQEKVNDAKLQNVVHVLGPDAKAILANRGFNPDTMKPVTPVASQFKVGDSVMYQGKSHKVTAIKPDGKLVLE